MQPQTKTQPKNSTHIIATVAVAGQVIPNAVVTQVQFATIYNDTLAEWQRLMAFSFSPVRAGWYHLHSRMRTGIVPIGITIAYGLQYNGVLTLDENTITTVAVGDQHLIVDAIVYLIPTDIIYVTCWHNNPPNITLIGLLPNTRFSAFRIS